jgi:hypothetical protein
MFFEIVLDLKALQPSITSEGFQEEKPKKRGAA